MSAAGFTLRQASASDVAAISAIEIRCFDCPAERFDPAKIASLLANRRTIGFVCEESGGRVIAWAAGFTRTHREPRWGRIYALAVDPNAQGRGIGRALVEKLSDAMQDAGAEQLFLEVRRDNAAAIGLYRQCGFENCRVLPNFYAPGVSAQRMVRTLETR